MDSGENKRLKGSVIAIDELDAHGNVVYSTTVPQELIDNPDFYFVDVEKCAEADPLIGDVSVIENGLECENNTDCEKKNNSKQKRKRRRAAFSDYDCVNDELVIQSEWD